MRHLHINAFPNRSTGSVMMREHKHLLDEGEESYVAWARGRGPEGNREFKIGTMADVYLHGIYVRITGKMGFASRRSTKALLKWVEAIDPDVVHLHCLHGYYINIELLFNWLAAHDKKVYWTQHDCWAFTGHCAHFLYAGCDQWLLHCACDRDCPQLGVYPKTLSRRSCAWNFEQKRKLFTSVEDMTIISPSQWLADLVSRSFLSKYPVEVRHNAVDTQVFKPTPSDIRKQYGLEEKFIVLGVASPWTDRKGFDDFLGLAQDLDDSYVVVLVGLSKKQMRGLPRNVIGLCRTESAGQLSALYTAADVLFNPTKEDNYPTVNLEAQACGTPVVCYDIGGCRETGTKGLATFVPAGNREASISAISALRKLKGN
ncbi:glycosyltransferase [Eggerthella lenta]|uniref:glycosyltransferase n=1 Tax=Eggerthella lenta TaxID=84112 RepID=UPI0018993F5B|nr:glycosyltransferase [Eggerthella lenta]MDB1807042.1 glycosyltransferase [Eggerthella lenta]